jgi:hypothetical protein
MLSGRLTRHVSGRCMRHHLAGTESTLLGISCEAVAGRAGKSDEGIEIEVQAARDTLVHASGHTTQRLRKAMNGIADTAHSAGWQRP